jgi:hypothetical protein
MCATASHLFLVFLEARSSILALCPFLQAAKDSGGYVFGSKKNLCCPFLLLSQIKVPLERSNFTETA